MCSLFGVFMSMDVLTKHILSVTEYTVHDSQIIAVVVLLNTSIAFPEFVICNLIEVVKGYTEHPKYWRSELARMIISFVGLLLSFFVSLLYLAFIHLFAFCLRVGPPCRPSVRSSISLFVRPSSKEAKSLLYEGMTDRRIILPHLVGR